MEFKESKYLSLDRLVYDKISFIRKGFENDNKLEKYIGISYEEEKELGVYITHVSIRGIKQDEYEFEVNVSGYFSVYGESTEEERDYALKHNTVSILFPYLRSKVSDLTSQPGMIPVVLDPTNTDEYVDEILKKNKEKNI